MRDAFCGPPPNPSKNAPVSWNRKFGSARDYQESIMEACAGPRVEFVPAKRPVTTALAQTADVSLPLSTMRDRVCPVQRRL